MSFIQVRKHKNIFFQKKNEIKICINCEPFFNPMNYKNKVLLLLALLLLFYCNVWSQGDISRRKKHKEKQEAPKAVTENNEKQTLDFMGVILDETTAEPLIGVTVFLEKEGLQKGALSDMNGKVVFSDLPQGTYKLKLTYVSYEGKEIPNITLEAGKQYQYVFTLKEVGVNVGEVVIQSDLRRESEASAILMQKMNLRMMDIFAGDMVLKSSSDLFINTSLSRMPGVVFIEDRYLGIRGMPERYNTVMLNGALLPIVQSDRQAFDFSNFPSNVISQIQLVKACMSDVPATFGGGLVSFSTPDIPDKNLVQVNYQAIHNGLSTFKPYTRGIHDQNRGFLGLFGGSKPYLPKDFPSSEYVQELSVDSEELAQVGRKVHHDFVTETFNAPPSQSISLTLKRRYQKQDHIYGFTVISNLTNSFLTQNIKQNTLSAFDSTLGYNPVSDSFVTPLYQNQQNYNQIINLGYQNTRWSVKFKNFITYSQWDKFVAQQGNFEFEGTWEPYLFNVKRFEKQFLYSNQGLISYQINENQKMELTLFSNTVRYEEPGLYPVNYSQNANGDWYISASWVPEDRVFYTVFSSKQRDFSYGANLFYDVKLFKKEHTFLSLKVGNFVFSQNRSFYSRKTGIVPTLDNPNITVQDYLANGYDFHYDPSLIRPGGFFFFDDTQIHDSYIGKSANIAPYAQAIYQAHKNLQIYTGVRVEFAETKITSVGTENKQVVHNQKIVDLLPSLILSYSLKEKSKIKLSICRSIVRPDMRELSRFSFFNPTNSITWEGNPEAVRSKINSLDLRYEYFGSNLNMFSATLFLKNIHRPLEQMLVQGDVVYLNNYVLRNSERARSVGIELEARQKLGDGNYLENIACYGNVMFQVSNVKDDRNGNSIRPLQGQSLYVVNTGILFKEPKTQIFLDIFYNRFGRQIVSIGVPGAFNNLYVLPRHRIDVQIGKTFKEKLLLKLAFQDILAQPFYKVQFKQEKNEKTADLEDATLVSRTQVGRLVTFSVQYKF